MLKFSTARIHAIFFTLALVGSPGFAAVFEVPSDIAPDSIGAGDTLNLRAGGVLSGSLSVESGGELNVYGGELDSGYYYGFAGSVINHYGGTLAGQEWGSEGVMNLYAGTPGDFAFLFGETNIYGGDAGKNAGIFGTVNLRGGLLQNNFYGLDTGVLNIFGDGLAIDGELVQGLQVGSPLLIQDRDVTITGDLSDGTPFTFDLPVGDSFILGPGDRDEGFTVTFTRSVPEPSVAFALGFMGLVMVGRRRR